MKNIIVSISLFLLLFITTFAQTISWSAYPTPAGQTLPYVYNTGTAPYNMTATISKNNTTQGDGTPKYTAVDPSSPCYTPQSLALYTNTFSSVLSSQNAHYNVNMRFNPSANGSCIRTSFTIKDINSEESWATFLDVIEITAVDGNGTVIPAANIVIAAAPNTTVVTSGTMKKIVGHNNSSEAPGSYFSSPCNTTTVTITPPATVPLQSVNIKYRPAYGTSTSNSYYNIWPRPATQYISISNISYTTTAGCTPLPVSLLSFEANCTDGSTALSWTTASELNNDYFIIERSYDGEKFHQIGRVNGNGTTNEKNTYEFHDTTDILSGLKYYRLSQTDYDGAMELLETRLINCDNNPEAVVTVYPNPSYEEIVIGFNLQNDERLTIIIRDITGRIVRESICEANKGQNFINFDISMLQKGVYVLCISGKNVSCNTKFLKK